MSKRRDALNEIEAQLKNGFQQCAVKNKREFPVFSRDKSITYYDEGVDAENISFTNSAQYENALKLAVIGWVRCQNIIADNDKLEIELDNFENDIRNVLKLPASAAVFEYKGNEKDIVEYGENGTFYYIKLQYLLIYYDNI